MKKLKIDDAFTLFLDRDGVINKNIDGGYVLSEEQFEFLPGVLEVMPKLAKLFPRIVVVTNQQCIAKGLLTEKELDEIHHMMMNMVELNGGRIDAVYYAPNFKSEEDRLRKPKNGMAFLAKADFPEIVFQKSVMVGDKMSDMEFGKSLDMYTILVSPAAVEDRWVDFSVRGLADLPDLFEFS